MSGIATAIVGGALISGVAGTMGASSAADAQTQAASQQAATASETLALQKQMYDADVARNKPFYDIGVEALPTMKNMVTGKYDMTASPAAQYELTQGTKTLNRQLAARGLLGSGNAAQRLGELSSGVAAKDYNDQYNRLLDQIKIGTGASAQTGQSSNTYNSAIGAAGSATEAAQANAGQARAALYSGMGGLAQSSIGTGINAFNAYNSYANSPSQATNYMGNTSGLNKSEYNRLMAL